jgi:DNA helicase-2/ATP-dependent DNA helicase PcrA
MKFDNRQTSVIETESRHTMVPATPGSGKSTTLSEWLFYLLTVKKIPMKQITVLMFNTEARKSFVNKMVKRTGLPVKEFESIKTFHSLGNALCKSLSARGLLPDLELFENDGQVAMMAIQAITSVIGQKQWRELAGNDNQAMDCFLQYVDLIKANELSPKDVFEALNLPEKVKFFEQAYHAFEELRLKRGKRTFADLIRDPYMLLSEDKELAARVGNQRQFVAVDEAQDMNPVQYGLFKIIAGEKARTSLIGDNDQTIYSWRGSDPEIMSLRYREDFPDMELLSLAKTYRYGHELALASSYCIDVNKKRIPTVCVALKESKPTSIHVHPTELEGKVAADIIQDKLKNHGASLKDFAILCRLYSAAAPLEIALLEKGIPVSISGGRSVLYSKEAKLIRAILALASGHYASSTVKDRSWMLEALLKSPSMQIKNADVESIIKLVAKEKSGVGYHTSNIKIAKLNKYQEVKLRDRTFAISDVEKSKKGAKAHMIIESFAKATKLTEGMGKSSLTKKNASEAKDTFKNLTAFIKRLDTDAAGAYEKINELISQCEQSIGSDGAITITSIYQAKGLDFPYVFIPGLSDSRFPHNSEGEFTIDHGMEEERRLFYVGITRGIKEVHLLCPKDSILSSHLETGAPRPPDYGDPKTNASRFLFELNLKRAKELAAKIAKGETFEPVGEVEVKYAEELVK